MNTLTTTPADVSPAASPLWAALALTALNSFSTGAISYGLFFIAHEQYNFNAQRNLLLGLLMGASYILGAVSISPLLRATLAKRHTISTRSVLLLLQLGLSLTIAIPGIVRIEPALWFSLPVYMILIGGVWPITESYISGGKKAQPLRHAISAFNVTWASAVIVAMWLIAPLLNINPLASLLLIAVIHSLCIPLMFALKPEPGHHTHLDPTPHPPIYNALLPVFRGLLFSSYLLGAVLSPLLPHRFDSLNIVAVWAAILTSSWMASRITMFTFLGFWHGWHGRWRTVIWTATLLLGGFALALLAQNPVLLVLGLLLFGLGMGGIYTAALYYAMSVGSSQVDAGSKHEAFIGLGFTLGPLAGLGGYWLTNLDQIDLSANQTTLLVSFMLVLIASGAALRSSLNARSG
jgi:hypothetical protein